MNRSMAYVGVALILAGVALVASPIAFTGHETLDDEQISGFLVAPIGLVVVLIAAVSFDPRRTTVHGGFGSTDEPVLLAPHATERPGFAHVANPKAPIHCRYCRTPITFDLVRCPRCGRDRSCRGCGRPLGLLDEQVTCRGCSRPELFCNCSTFGAPTGLADIARASRGR